MKLRRGFKSEAEKLSLQVRYELKLRFYDYLSAHELAAHLGIIVLAVNKIPGLSAKDMQLICSGDVSAIAVVGNNPPLIIHNHLHAATRQESNLMHEIAHCMLGHRPKYKKEEQAFFLHSYDPEQEEEASWLGGCLQIPRKGLLWAINNGMKDIDIASRFRASHKMVKYRCSITGINRQLQRKKF